jgi:hypothetical protein
MGLVVARTMSFDNTSERRPAMPLTLRRDADTLIEAPVLPIVFGSRVL